MNPANLKEKEKTAFIVQLPYFTKVFLQFSLDANNDAQVFHVLNCPNSLNFTVQGLRLPQLH
jgi:hypothetical protein